jgi:hypothetical protein
MKAQLQPAPAHGLRVSPKTTTTTVLMNMCREKISVPWHDYYYYQEIRKRSHVQPCRIFRYRAGNRCRSQDRIAGGLGCSRNSRATRARWIHPFPHQPVAHAQMTSRCWTGWRDQTEFLAVTSQINNLVSFRKVFLSD